MAQRIPQQNDRVRCKRGYGLDYEGDTGIVTASDPSRASQHRCTVRWDSDGGLEYIDSTYLWIIADAPPKRRKVGGV